jgi:hypothetical protein
MPRMTRGRLVDGTCYHNERMLIASAQAHFHVPGLFSVSLSLRGSEPGDTWFMVDVEFDIKVGGDDTGVIGKEQHCKPDRTE